MRILVDADGCPVKHEVYRVATRCGLPVVLVANAWLTTPATGDVSMVVVPGAHDAADDWIAANVTAADIVVTADIPLAARCLAQRAEVLDPRGRRFTDDDIGGALASRAIAEELRASGGITSGPPPFRDRDRSQFLQALDAAVQRVRRRR